MSKIFQFGETVDGYQVNVLNEREVRATAGIMFMFAFVSLILILFKGDFLLAKFFITFFMVDFAIRVFINPKFSPSLIIGRLIVANQKPEYVGAPQKKFAWIIGLILSASMFGLMILFNTYSIITGLICLVCLIFLFFEAVFGICLGCIFYNLLYKEKAQHCPGYTCERNQREPIQKTSFTQLLVLFLFVLFIILSVYSLKDVYSNKPTDLWQKLGLKKEVSE